MSNNTRKIILEISRNSIKVAGLAGVALLFVWFSGREIKKNSSLISQDMVANTLDERRNEDMVRLKDNFTRIGNRGEKVKQALLPSDNILPFVDRLEKLAVDHAVTQSVKFGVPTPFPIPTTSDSSNLTLYSVDYNLTINGTVAGLTEYLKDLESLPYFSGVSSITLNAPASGTWSDSSTIYIQAKLYVR